MVDPDPLAGVRDLDSLKVDRPLSSLSWRAPHDVWLEGSSLAWRILPDHFVDSGPGLLEGFLRLWKGSDDDILNYARKWGVLWLCQIHQPKYDPSPPREHPSLERDGSPLGRIFFWCLHEEFFGKLPNGKQVTHRIALESWRRHSRQTLAILRVTSRLRRGLGLDETDLKILRDADDLSRALDNRDAWDSVLAGLNNWLWYGGVGFYVQRSKGLSEPLKPVMIGHDLAGVLAVQLFQAAVGRRGLAICDECAELFAPKRRPARGRLAYCENCGRPAAVRNAGDDFRNRKRKRK